MMILCTEIFANYIFKITSLKLLFVWSEQWKAILIKNQNESIFIS